MIKTVGNRYDKTYVGYTFNLRNRLQKHNSGKGAKSTKGHKWKVIYKKKFLTQIDAMKYEYKLKKNTNKKLLIYKNYK